MSAFVLYPSAVAEWHALIGESEQVCNQYLKEDVESYLVFLLMRFARSAQLANSIIGIDFLKSQQQWTAMHKDKLRDAGDQCLLLAGLFPEQACRRHVQLDYFVEIGRSAYYNLSYGKTATAELYNNLAEDFICMIDVLQATRRVGE